MKNPKISVILPTYNAEKYLQESIESILNQSFQDFELLIIDDFSKDATRLIVNSYKDRRIRLVDGPKRGLAAALNWGIKIAKGEYIARMDADDISLPERFEKQVSFLDKHADVSLVGSWQQKFGASNNIHCPAEKHEDIKIRLLFSCDLCHSTLMWRRKDFITHNLFYNEKSPQEDYELWLRAIKKLKFHNLQEVLGKYRVSGKSISDKKAIVLRDYETKLIVHNVEKLFGLKINSTEYSVLQKRMIEGCPKDENKKIARHVFFEKLLKINNKKRLLNDKKLRITLEWLWKHTICGRWQDFVTQQNKKIKISVILPVYNVEKYLDTALRSVLSQSLNDIEVICVNDGSTDGSLKKLEEWSLRDSRIVLLDQSNQGAGPARNYGIRFARGEYIAFLDPDDYYPDNNTLELMYVAAKREKALIVGGSLWEDRKGKYKKNFYPYPNFGYTFRQNGFIEYQDYQFDYSYQRFIYKTSFINKSNLYFPPLLRFQDPPFFINAMIKARRFYALAVPTYVYRYSYKQINWNKEKIADLIKGLLFNLKVSKKHQLAQLHYLTYYRILKEFPNEIFKNISWSTVNAVKLLDRNIDNDLIRRINPGFKNELTISQVLFEKNKYQKQSFIKLFDLFPFCQELKKGNITQYTIFSIPLIKTVTHLQSVKYYLLGFIPLLKIRNK